MPLSVLRAFVDTLTPDGSTPLAEDAAARWGADAGSIRYVRASANAVVTFRAADKPLVLRLTSAATRTPAAVASELAFAELLAERGVPVARPVRSSGGALVEPAGSWHAVAFELVDGVHRELGVLSGDDVARWGEALGRLHAAAAGWPGRDRQRWEDVDVPPGEPAARTALADVLDRLRDVPHDVGIHGDFELDNVLWRADGSLGIVDLDDCAPSWAAADVAFALRDVFDDRVEAVDPGDERVRAFVAGYRAARPLPDREVALLPVFLRLHQVATLARLLRVVDVPDSPDLPPWLAALRAALVAKIDFYRAELLIAV